MRAGDKVAERHPYSVYRRNEMDKYTDVRQQDPFTTSFGEGLPFRAYDRNLQGAEGGERGADNGPAVPDRLRATSPRSVTSSARPTASRSVRRSTR